MLFDQTAAFALASSHRAVTRMGAAEGRAHDASDTLPVLPATANARRRDVRSRDRRGASVAGRSAPIGASNFFEVAVAAAISPFGSKSGAALATVVGVLIEVPVMLSVV